MPRSSRIRSALLCLVAVGSLSAQVGHIDKFAQKDKFRQLDSELRSPNVYRTASGAPGHEYWQQQADYRIKVTLDDRAHTLTGTETIDYANNSPDTLRYLWVQLDANIFAPDSRANLVEQAPSSLDRMSFRALGNMKLQATFDGGCKVTAVKDARGGDLHHVVNGTNMRIDLTEPLLPGGKTRVQIDWHYDVNDSKMTRGRTGYEMFEEDGNAIYEIAQWFPRMCAYADYSGWNHKEYLGSGEFTLEFGDYEVSITAPVDHVVAATGVLQNPGEVLTAEQRERLEKARTADAPVFVVTPEEAKAAEKEKATDTKTWTFKAQNVRDFAWASSRKYAWDAWGHDVDDNPVLCMSFFPNEGEPLWSRYSTQAIVHTLNVYSRYTFKYPYPVAISCNGPVGGMEYPMICFNGPRPEKDGTYSKYSKYGLISVIIHEVGHNYFPMIVNSDERQWTWMDEGLNTFCQYLAEVEWEDDYPSSRGEPARIAGYMRSTGQVPIMTNSESILQFGNNAYAKPATALNVLRETILGRELFDFAFKTYAQRWMFKRPTPDDFFRTMEDASGRDLDWFWRGWFYSTDHVDIALTDVKHYRVGSPDPEVENKLKKEERDAEPTTVSEELNAELPKRVDQYETLKDFYNDFDSLDVTEEDRKSYQKTLKGLSDEQKKLLEDTSNFYVLTFENQGGLVMPILIGMEFEDGTKDMLHVPVEIWTRDNEEVTKLVITEKAVKTFTVDPRLQTADVDLTDNVYPPRQEISRFQLYKSSGRGRGANDMKKAQQAEAARKKAADDAEKKKAGKAAGVPEKTKAEAKVTAPDADLKGEPADQPEKAEAEEAGKEDDGEDDGR